MTSLRSFRPGDTTPWPSHIALKQSRSSGRTWKVVNAAQSPTLLGQAVLEAGLQAFERVGRSFQPLPAGFPPGPAGDVAIRMLSNPLRFLEEMSQTYGGLVGLVLGGEHVVLVSDPAAAQEVLIDQGSSFVKEGTAFFPGSRLAGQGLLVSDGALWQRQRQLSNPAFRRAAVETYTEAMSRGAQALVSDTWRGRVQREVYADFNDLTLQITTDSLFGTSLTHAESAAVTGAVRTAMEFFASRSATGFMIPEWLPTPDNVQYNSAVSHLDDIVYRIIRQRRQHLQSAATPKCLLDNLLSARDEAGRGMSDTALRDELMTLLIAGQETSAIVLAWTTALLAHHPGHQVAAAEEVSAILQGSQPNAENIKGLHSLEAVVLEAMRLMPPAYMVGRCAAQRVTLQGFTLPQGTTFLVSPHLLHRNPRCWAQPGEFRPQRWKQFLEGAKPGAYMGLLSGMGPNGAYLPFGAGQRNCIGTGFAMTEAVLVLAAILQKFQLAPLPGQQFPAPEPRITLRPSKVNLALSPRG